nr:NUDIX hydrolase [uncultured Gellertiella sp.]
MNTHPPVAPEPGLHGFPPDGTIFPLRDIELRILEGEHPLHAANRQAIADNWDREVAANPTLYNGRLVFQRRLSLEGDRLTGEGHLVPYSTHLWWRRQTDRSGGIHAFAWGVPVSSDGAVIAIRMGAKTANPGLVYCAAGSFEAEDVVDGRVDLAANTARELKEETGLDLRDSTTGSGWHGLGWNHGMVFFRIHRFALSAGEMLEQVRQHMRVDHEKEIEAAIAITDPDPALHCYSQFMPPILKMVLSQPASPPNPPAMP